MTIHNQLDKAAADGGGVLWWVTGGWLHKLIPQRSSNLQQSVQEWEDCGVNVLFKMLCYLGHVKVTYMKNGIRTHNFHRDNVPQRTRSLGWIHEPTTICSLQRRSMKKGRCLLFFAGALLWPFWHVWNSFWWSSSNNQQGLQLSRMHKRDQHSPLLQSDKSKKCIADTNK